MKSKIIAFGTALLCAAGAHAQTSVTFSGAADVFAGSMKMAGDATRQTGVTSGGMMTSWWGITGTEDLGGGLKAGFALTSFFQMDTGVQGRFPGDTLFSRDANVSLSGDFGTIQLGRGMAPNFLPSVIGNPFAGSFTFSPLILHMNVPLFNGSGWNSTTPADTGWNNEIVYSTPNFSGLSANFHYQFGEQASNNSLKNIGANFMYFGGPLTLTGFYERDQVSNPGVSTSLGATKKDWMLLSAYDLGMVKPYLSYGEAKADNTAIKGKTVQLGASVPTSPAGKVMLEYARTEMTQIDTKRKTFTAGYDYKMSKRTDVYAMLMNDRITNQTTGTSFGLGIRHQF